MSVLFFTALTYLLVQSSCHLALKLRSTLWSLHLTLLIYIILSLSLCSVGFFLLLKLPIAETATEKPPFGYAPSAFFFSFRLSCMFAVSGAACRLYPCLVSESALSLPLPAWVQSEWILLSLSPPVWDYLPFPYQMPADFCPVFPDSRLVVCSSAPLGPGQPLSVVGAEEEASYHLLFSAVFP